MPLVTLAVPDLSCGNCARHIREALADVPGLGACSVDIPARQVRLETADQGALEAARARLADEGYPATVIG